MIWIRNRPTQIIFQDNSCHCTDTVYTFGQYEYDDEYQEKERDLSVLMWFGWNLWSTKGPRFGNFLKSQFTLKQTNKDLAQKSHKKASKNLQNFIGSFVRNVNQPKISSNETFPESSKGSIVAHLGKYWNNLNCCHESWLKFCQGFDDSDEIKIVENGKKSKCDLWDELKTRADLCGMGEKDKCFINWAKLSEFVQKIKAKMQKN